MKTQSQIAVDNDSVITEIEIAAPPERVFQALIDREQALQWGKGEGFQITSWEISPHSPALPKVTARAGSVYCSRLRISSKNS
jgi:hypothetical protein